MTSIDERRTAFRALHQQGCFVLPNPWDAGTARALERAGFRALATTSAGFAFSRGLPDGAVAGADMLAHVRELVGATSLPVNADLEDGYGATAAEVAANVRACVDARVAGLSIEDATGDPAAPLYPADEAAARLRAARGAIDAAGGGVVLTCRTEGFVVGRPDLAETIRRLVAYAEAGADCLYAPGLTTREQVAAVVKAVAPRPVNVLAGGPAFTVAELAALGVRRVSLGSALARAAWGAFLEASREIAERGTFERLGEAAGYAALNGLFRPDGGYGHAP
ncbi:PEP phosphonomutase [Anaeromyxobacter dehalogenans 2CP-1]|uniref:PEP phosphonomutase n=1 Tax=Anaeromyxobacter dehalogenans (strain ATCC BAA-258 / DSM 21875 / 2CP-1) TaxID=455488 RepID=B8J5T4_ANAD2|nr:isocitrate lyase/phosphoenolpyruvate mutase family protein [Anaeromyxobacter dehalogenans]ACL65031.1 PEP phosphonomutase [Anaeromyxobacter dehalogenans 2CP-1]